MTTPTALAVERGCASTVIPSASSHPTSASSIGSLTTSAVISSASTSPSSSSSIGSFKTSTVIPSASSHPTSTSSIGSLTTSTVVPSASSHPTNASSIGSFKTSTVIPSAFSHPTSGSSIGSFKSRSPISECVDPRVWEQAFSEHKVTCVCMDLMTGERKTVIRPRVSNERLLRAFLIGLGTSTVGLILFTLVYFTVKTIKKWAKDRKAQQANDYLSDKEEKRPSKWGVLSCFHCGDLAVHMHTNDPSAAYK
ncbi:hypothetical protein PoB_007575300 [Plakobranchus ocellatus]|uniref:Uncharacterized protein n=1 Tax=Plakobranchus ocellatus TaxID=259542 RepID=A0AAV4DY87_9GAST|nr:hypothetical protein PoB_007575300 [Plakobranchus ocellatus]